MGENPSWWNMSNPRSAPSSSAFDQPSQPSTLLSMSPWHDGSQELPDSWSQLLLGGMGQDGDKYSLNPFQHKRMGNWEDPVLYPSLSEHNIDVKQEISDGGYALYGHEGIHGSLPSWAQTLQTSSPTSCVTTSLNHSMLDFSSSKAERNHQINHPSEYNSTTTGSGVKKARIPASSHSTLKVRKEKLGDRITALHQLVSPFGKTDTASVLMETFGYIRFLQNQIEALSSPYLGSGSMNTRQHVHGERSCIFPEDPGQLLNGAKKNRRGAFDQDDDHEPKQDLKSRGLCLLPVSLMMNLSSDNSADYWPPSFDGGCR